MGCWNETCGVSKMRIKSGESIRLLPIVMNPFHVHEVKGLSKDIPEQQSFSGQSGCYIGDLWTPLCYPIRGEYNDYGSIEDVPDSTDKDKAELAQFLGAFKKYCLPIELGENKCHDVSLKDFTLTEILEALQEGRCYMLYKSDLPQYKDRLIPISWMMIKESVWQSLLTTDVKKSGETWKYKEDKFDRYTLDGIKQEITSKMATIKKSHELDKIDPKTASQEDLKKLLEAMREMALTFGRISGQSLRFWHNSPLDCPELNERLIDIVAECEYIHTMLGILRINYAPTTGSGSQCDNYRLWKLVNKRWARIINQELAQMKSASMKS